VIELLIEVNTSQAVNNLQNSHRDALIVLTYDVRSPLPSDGMCNNNDKLIFY